MSYGYGRRAKFQRTETISLAKFKGAKWYYLMQYSVNHECQNFIVTLLAACAQNLDRVINSFAYA